MPKAVSPGGSATLYGVLYQLLGSLHQTARLQIEGDPVRTARIEVEPGGGGGDLRVETPEHRRVEQWKARTNGRPWGLQEILDHVIPDLYRDKALDFSTDQTCYVFATEGRLGRKAQAFFDRLHVPVPEKKPLNGLEKQDLELFRATARRLRKLPDFPSEPIDQTHWKLRRLLSRFKVRENQTADRLVREIDQWLLSLVEAVEEIPATRDQLCMLLLRRGAGKGLGKAFMPEDLLREAGLYGISLESDEDVRRTAREVLEREIARRGYDEAKDVRETPAWPENKRIVFVSGESGQGKTWQIAGLALGRWRAHRLVVLVDSRGDADRDLEKASNLLWKDAWGRDQPISLDRIVERWKRVRGIGGRPWLTVCVDNVQNLSEARALLREGDWERWGAELVLAGPLYIGNALAQEEPERVHHLRLRDFTPAELREYLRRHGRSWETVPADVRDTLKRPLLAGIYTNLGSDPDWAPTHEYELYERSWQRIERDVSEHKDRPFVLKLALRLLEKEPRYPWTREDLKAAGVDSEAHARLERAGWWRSVENDEEVEVWHDRMLSWAVAEALAKRARTENPAARLMANPHSRATRAGRILAYVTMDLLWILSDDAANFKLVSNLLISLEGEGRRLESRWLYRSNLFTLGRRIIPGLLERIRRIRDQDRYSVVAPAVELISKIMAREPDAREVLPPLLADRFQLVRRIAVGTLARHPHAGAIDPLWGLLRKSSLQMEQTRRREGIPDRQAAFAALRSCLVLDPDWLRRKIQEIEREEEPVWELAYLLANLKHPLARSIWLTGKSDLFERVPPGKLHSLMVCIRVFRDKDEISRLEAWLSVKEEWTDNNALEGIARIDPDRAVSLLGTVPLSELLASRGAWLPMLLLARPDESRRALRERMLAAGEGFWRVAQRYWWYEEQLDRETVEALLDRLVSELEQAGDEAVEDARNRIRVPLDQLSRIHRVDLLRCFEARVGTALDRRLGELAARSLGRSHLDLDKIFAVLLKVAGVGLVRLIREGLASEDPDQRAEATARGLILPEELREVPQPGMWVLAAVGTDQSLVAEMMSWEEEIENDDLTKLWRLRRWKPPISDADLAPALEGLGSGDLQRRVRGMAAVSISGRHDLLSGLPEWLEGLGLDMEDLAPLDDRACYLVHHLGDEDLDSLERVARKLDVVRFPWTAIQVLHEGASAELAERLEAYLLERYATVGRLGTDELNQAIALEQRSPLSDRLLQAVWESGKNLPPELWSNRRFYSAVSRLDSEDVREEIWEEAFEARSAGRRISAIRALRSFEPEEAIRAARRGLEDLEIPDRRLFVDILLEIGGQDAVPLLLDVASQERKTEVLWEIARALRQAGPRVEAELRERLEAPEFPVREVAAHLAGWQGPGFLELELQRLGAEEPDTDVQWECLQALDRQNKERCTLELMEAFRSAEGTACWSYLDSILALGDPYLLWSEEDRLWLGKILTSDLGAMEIHADFRTRKRFTEVNRAAEQRDRSAEG